MPLQAALDGGPDAAAVYGERWLADQPVTRTAVPDEGYAFVGWEGVEGEGSEVALTPEGDVDVRLVFAAEP